VHERSPPVPERLDNGRNGREDSSEGLGDRRDDHRRCAAEPDHDDSREANDSQDDNHPGQNYVRIALAILGASRRVRNLQPPLDQKVVRIVSAVPAGLRSFASPRSDTRRMNGPSRATHE
jgi:hypothetical protein